MAPVSRARWEQEAHEGEGDHLRVGKAIDSRIDDVFSALSVDHSQTHASRWVFNDAFLQVNLVLVLKRGLSSLPR